MAKLPSIKAVLLALIPFFTMCFSVHSWNCVEPLVLGLPFNIFWLTAWIIITPLIMRQIYKIEATRNRNNQGEDEDNGR